MLGGAHGLIFLANSGQDASAVCDRGILEADGVRSLDRPRVHLINEEQSMKQALGNQCGDVHINYNGTARPTIFEPTNDVCSNCYPIFCYIFSASLLAK